MLATTRPCARTGAASVAPLVVGLVPFGLAVGAAVARSGDRLAGWTGTLVLYGGSAQLAVVDLVGSGSGVAAAVGAGLLVNARLAVYTTSLATRWRGQPRWFRLLAGATTVDPLWALATARPTDLDPRVEREVHLGATALLTVGWLAAVTAGMALGPVADGLGLELTGALCLLVLVVPRLAGRADRAAAAAGGGVAVLAAGRGGGTGLLLAVAAGTAAGVLADRGVAP
jgi:predicted branched-subunit amino acid permease